MNETKVTFTSDGLTLAGVVRVPDGVKPGERRSAFVTMHGFGSNMNSNTVLEPCKMLEQLGYVTCGSTCPAAASAKASAAG